MLQCDGLVIERGRGGLDVGPWPQTPHFGLSVRSEVGEHARAGDAHAPGEVALRRLAEYVLREFRPVIELRFHAKQYKSASSGAGEKPKYIKVRPISPREKIPAANGNVYFIYAGNGRNVHF